jgi:trk system potassium uptake protein TrkH
MGKNDHLKKLYCAILSYTGVIFILVSFLLLTPLLVLIQWAEEVRYSMGFLLPALILGSIGVIMWRGFRVKEPAILTVQEGGVIVLLSWTAVCVFSACPFMMILKLNFTQALFEAVSGWTTTGLSVVDVRAAPKIILLWRSITQFAGGAGLAIIMLSAITGPVGPGFSIAEGRTDQLVPNVHQSAKLVFYLYSGYVLVGTLGYWLCGMTFFDAVNHAMTALSTGGFSTRVESIGYWDSPSIEAISLVLMLFGNFNFLTAYTLLHGKFKAFCRNGEIRLMTVVLPIAGLILFVFVCHGLYPTLTKSFRVAIFEAASALTTTGFSTVSYTNWRDVGVFVIIVLMLIGGGTCSTAGAIKQYRIYVLFKSVVWEIKRALLPRTAIVENHVWQGEQKTFIKDQHIKSVASFTFLYLITFVSGSGIIMAHGYPLKESLFEFASSVGTVGLSVGITSSSVPPLVLWTQIIGMFLGRLEFFVIFVSIGKIVRDILHNFFKV